MRFITVASQSRRRFPSRNRRSRTRRSLRHTIVRAVSAAVILSLFASSTPASAPATLVALAKESSVSFEFWLNSSGLANSIQRAGTASAPEQEKQSDRDQKVGRIQIFPGDVTIDLSDRVSFSAVAYDRDDKPVGGVQFKWSGKSSTPESRVRLSPRGEFEAITPGSFTIIAEGAGTAAQTTVVVRSGFRRNLSQKPTSTRDVSTRDLPSKGDTEKQTVTPMLAPEGGWGDGDYLTADDPGNGVGNPPGGPSDGGAGSGNFQFASPVLSLPGRGIDITLGLAYNSRLWNKSGTQVSFDNDRGWPAPGFSLGFGKLLGMGVNNGGMLVDADGSRHSYSGTITFYPWGTYFVGHTTDGSFIDYSYSTGTGGGIVYAQARLANGTIITYGAPGPGAVYPTTIEDANGNFINITYVNNSGPRIQNVNDTLGRVIEFYYDSNNLLTAITAPGLNGGSARSTVRLHYRQLNLAQNSNYGFSSSVTTPVRDPYPWVVDAIFYPGTNTGYWFGDSDSYSSYGMLAKVIEQRGMSFSASSLTDMGSASQGLTTRSETYNYPLGPNYTLTDAPTYTSVVASWTRDGVNFDSATTSFDVHENSTPRTVTVTLPNGTSSKQYSYNAPGQFNDGLIYLEETRDNAGTVLQSSSSTWAQGAYESPRAVRTERTDERGQVTAGEFSYGSVYNQVTEVRDYDYGGTTLLRVTRTQYQNNIAYTGRHIFNLPLTVETFAGDNVTRVSRTDYQYDGQTLTQRADVIHHDLAYDPYAADEGYCYFDYDWSDPDCSGSCPPDVMGCDGFCPQIYYCPFDPSTNYRGHITQITSYADAINLTGAVTETRRYDIAGNMVTASTSCCEQTSFNYSVDTQYAYPFSKTRGSATDPYAQVTTSATYDFNTGFALSMTDVNGRQTQTFYDAATMRPTSTVSATGAHQDYSYDDAGISLSQTTYLGQLDGGGMAGKSVKLLNGMGKVRQEQALGPNNVWDLVDTIYDNMGRVSQQSRPYRGGETPQFATTAYDSLSRSTSMTAPDGSTTQTFYNEAARPDTASGAPGETTRIRDAWGRERWGRNDSTGRLVEIVEPNPSGNGSVATGGLLTTYSYDALGNLTQVNQGAQTRFFRYDSFGRMTAQKLAEMSATLNDVGSYVGSGPWSDVFTYDDRSNLTSRTDARGVKVVHSYNGDPLNRLQSVSWDTSGFGDTANPIVSAAAVTYQYRQKTSPSELKDITQLEAVTASGTSTESYAYDTEGRISSKTLTLTSRPSYPFVTDYILDTLDRLIDVRYPAEYGNGSAPRKVVHHSYDIANRLTGVTFGGQSFASNIAYNASGQSTALNVGSGTNQVAESYGYSAQTGLLDTQTVVRGGSTLLSLSYDYASASGKRTGQLTRITNNLDASGNHNRSYSYDALGRLVLATGGPSAAPLWSQTYAYDRYGNRTSVAATGNTARLEKPAEPRPQLPSNLLAFNAGDSGAPKRPSLAGPDPSVISDTPTGIRLGPTAEASTTALMAVQSGPVFTDDPLTAGVTIKAMHITELRTAVNQARSLGGLAAASWAEPVTSGVAIKAAHIVELRTRLNEARAALGLTAASYTDPSLTSGIAVKAVHIQELRDKVREALAGNGTCPAGQNLSTDQFVKNFYQGALARQPNSAELQSWAGQLKQAYYQGQAQQLATAQYMGRQLFKSQEYINRNRDDHSYVYDLYKAYLQREPDQGGWDFWTAQVAANGRDNVRVAFEVSSEFANKVASLCPGSGGSAPVPLDGLPNLAYNAATNRITTSGFSYDAAGNQTRIVRADGSAQRFKYDAANRLVTVLDDYGYTIASYTYGDTRERLIANEGNLRTYYASDSDAVIGEYTEIGGATLPAWSKGYVYLGARLLSTLQPDGSGSEGVQFNHPDRLGTRLVTKPADGTSFEQVSLPFGTPLNAESTGSTNRRFTSYDRSAMTGLDYAVNRHYDAQQGRFTQVDPIGMQSVALSNPQTLNLFAYCANDPVNHTDPAGLGFFSFLKKLFKKIGHFLSAVSNAIARVLNNRWVRIGVLILGFIVPFLGPLAKAIQLALKIYNTIADIVGQMQLFGMLLQGKFKQLGMSLINGFIGSFIATIENGIIQGLHEWIGDREFNGQHYIDWSKFSFKDFFSGVWNGLKTGLKDAANQLLRYRHDPKKKKSFWKRLADALIPGYGHWCGAGIGQGANEGRTGVNGVDEGACRPHDGRYNTPGYDRLDADFEMFGHLLIRFPMLQVADLAFGMGPSIGSTYKFAALPLFGAILPAIRFTTGWGRP